MSRAELDAARTDPLEELVLIQDLADALGVDRTSVGRRLYESGYNIVRVVDNRTGINKWKVAVSREDAAKFISEMKRQGYGQARRTLVSRADIAEMVGKIQ